AGIYRMEWRRFLLFTTLGTTLWNLLLMGAGWWLGSRWRELLLLIKQYEQGVWIVLLVIGLGFVLTRLNARRRVSEKPREVSGDPP
ncbi:MAG: hypothetical protein ACT4QE_04100, partial [Anaerolineales bacterium]